MPIDQPQPFTGYPMRYLIAVLFPPLAVLLCGKPGQAFLNFFLTLLLYVPGLIHALMVVASTEAEARNQRLVRAVQFGQYQPR